MVQLVMKTGQSVSLVQCEMGFAPERCPLCVRLNRLGVGKGGGSKLPLSLEAFPIKGVPVSLMFMYHGTTHTFETV